MNKLLFFDMKIILFFQISLTKRHEIKSLGIAELLKALPKTIRNIYFIFIVSNKFAKYYFKAQDVLDSGTISLKRSNWMSSSLDSYLKQRACKKLL